MLIQLTYAGFSKLDTMFTWRGRYCTRMNPNTFQIYWLTYIQTSWQEINFTTICASISYYKSYLILNMNDF